MIGGCAVARSRPSTAAHVPAKRLMEYPCPASWSSFALTHSTANSSRKAAVALASTHLFRVSAHRLLTQLRIGYHEGEVVWVKVRCAGVRVGAIVDPQLEWPRNDLNGHRCPIRGKSRSGFGEDGPGNVVRG